MMADNSKIEKDDSANESVEARESIYFLFGEIAPDASLVIAPCKRKEFLESLLLAFRSTRNETQFALALNELARRGGKRNLYEQLSCLFFQGLFERGIRLPVYSDAEADWAPYRIFFAHGARIFAGITYLADLQRRQRKLAPDSLSFFWPEVKEMLSGEAPFDAATSAASLRKLARESDRFGASRVFRYQSGEFEPLSLCPERSVNQFFGYRGVRQIFQQYFAAFAANGKATPLLISSLPGLGKTQLTIAHALHHPELILIFPELSALDEKLEELLHILAAYPERKFVLFFDDIDPETVNWYYFRTQVGGSFSLTDNVAIVIASNYEYPVSVMSRGRAIAFPIFDEIQCQEMIADFLSCRGMKKINNNLVAVIAADYTEEFGQKLFNELSPRTLMRYLEIYRTNAKKRMQMLDFSQQELILKPDAQLFYEFNIQLQRTLYGDAYIEKLLKEKLDKLGKS